MLPPADGDNMNTETANPIIFDAPEGQYIYSPHDMQIYPLRAREIEVDSPCLCTVVETSDPDYARATISVISGCNLGCSYCVFGAMPMSEMRRMNIDTGKAIIDYLCTAFQGKVERITLSFTSNGEPTLNLEVIEGIKAYCRSKNQEGGSPKFLFNFATNSIPLSEIAIDQYLREPDQSVFFSLDGPPELHNCTRTNRNGKGSYDASIRKIEFYRDHYADYDKGFSSSTVLTARDEGFDQILLHLDGLGFEYIVMRPIRGKADGAFGFDETTLPIFMRGYEKMLDLVEERAIAGDARLLYKICNRYDFFGRLFTALLLREERVQGCPGCPPKHSDIAQYTLVFDVDGSVYFPCRDFIGRPEFCIGNVFTSVDLGRIRDVMSRARTTNRSMCQACWAHAMCGGSCYNAALGATGSVETPDETLCILTRYLAQRATRLAYRLQTLQPEILTQLSQRAISVTPWVLNKAY